MLQKKTNIPQRAARSIGSKKNQQAVKKIKAII